MNNRLGSNEMIRARADQRRVLKYHPSIKKLIRAGLNHTRMNRDPTDLENSEELSL